MTLDPGQEGVRVCPADHARPVQGADGVLRCQCGKRFPCEDNRNAAAAVGIALDIVGE